MLKLALRNICKSFGSKKILDNINLDLKAGEIVSIFGSSGCGKSVLLKTILGIIDFDDGDILYDGAKLDKSNYDLFLKNVSVSFQGGALFDSKNVYDNIVFPFLSSHYERPSDVELAKSIDEILEKIGLDKSVLGLNLNELSGGMQKRVSFARALITKPEIVFLDEPTSGLDIENTKLIFEFIKNINKDYGIAFIIITHDFLIAPKISDTIYYLEHGQLIKKNNVEY